MKPSALKALLLGLPFLFPLGLALDLWLGDHKNVAGQSVTSQVMYGENEMAPPWMPKSWVRPFLKEINLESSQSIFSQDLKQVSKDLNDSVWIESVDIVQRDFKGNMSLNITVRKPICVIRREKRLDRYLDRNLMEMPILSFRSPEKLKDETLPVVLVGSLIPPKVTKQDRDQWLIEMGTFLKEWTSAGLEERLALHLIDMIPYQSKAARVCRLKLMTVDLKFKGPVIIEWGVHREFNELEGRKSAQKWDDLKATLAQERPFSSLDLRYQSPDITY
jgi:hypothetical protein